MRSKRRRYSLGQPGSGRDPLPSNPSDLCAYNRRQHPTLRVYEALGIRGSKIPPDMMGTYIVDGYNVLVRPPSRGGHRLSIEVILPSGRRKWVNPGRLGQALCCTGEPGGWAERRLVEIDNVLEKGVVHPASMQKYEERIKHYSALRECWRRLWRSS